MRCILFFVYFGIAWKNILADVLSNHDPNEENVFFCTRDSEGAKNALTLRLESFETKFAELDHILGKLSYQYGNLIERLGFEESEKESERLQAEDNVMNKFYEDADTSSATLIGGKLYYIEHEQKLDWIQARMRCEHMDLQLVGIENEEDWNAIRELLDPHKNYWVDISEDEGNFVSKTTPNEPPFLMWYTSGPENLPAPLDCVELKGEYEHYMNVVSCFKQNYFICRSSNLRIKHLNVNKMYL